MRFKTIIDIIVESIFENMFCFLEPATAMIIASIISSAGSMAGGFFGGGGGYDGEIDYEQLPDYPESEEARKSWWEKLQQFGKEPGYGAIQPDYGDLWESAKQKVSRYYWGGPSGPGLAGKVKASAARRGVSDSPAQQEMLARMGMQEGIELKDIATNQAYQKAVLSEEGRRTWLNSIQGLSSLKPAYVTSTGTTGGGYGAGNMISDVSSAAGGALNQWGQNKWYEDMLAKFGTGQPQKYPGGYQPKFGSAKPVGNAPTEYGMNRNNSWWN